jgi:hypothetical protein
MTRTVTMHTCFASQVLDAHVLVRWTCPAHFASKGHANTPGREPRFMIPGSESGCCDETGGGDTDWPRHRAAGSICRTVARPVSVAWHASSSCRRPNQRVVRPFISGIRQFTFEAGIFQAWNPTFARDA